MQNACANGKLSTCSLIMPVTAFVSGVGGGRGSGPFRRFLVTRNFYQINGMYGLICSFVFCFFVCFLFVCLFFLDGSLVSCIAVFLVLV